jgi:hypothetical protein
VKCLQRAWRWPTRLRSEMVEQVSLLAGERNISINPGHDFPVTVGSIT